MLVCSFAMFVYLSLFVSFRAIGHMFSVLFWPIFPWILQIVLFSFWGASAIYLAATGKKKYSLTNTTLTVRVKETSQHCDVDCTPVADLGFEPGGGWRESIEGGGAPRSDPQGHYKPFVTLESGNLSAWGKFEPPLRSANVMISVMRSRNLAVLGDLCAQISGSPTLCPRSFNLIILEIKENDGVGQLNAENL